MSKYNLICKAYADARKKICAISFTEKMLDKLIDYFEMPVQYFLLYNLESNDFFQKESLLEVFHQNEDFNWEFHIGITAFEKLDCYPNEIIIIHFIIKENSNKNFIVCIAGEEEEFEIKSDKDFTILFEYIFSIIIDSYKNELIVLPDNEQISTIRQIGLRQNTVLSKYEKE